MFLLQLGGDPVVVADEQGLQGGQLDVLVAAHVAGDEQVLRWARPRSRWPC